MGPHPHALPALAIARHLIEQARIPSGASSSASERVSERIAALAAPYAESPCTAFSAALDETFTNTPPPEDFISGTRARAERQTAPTLVSKVRCQPASLMCSSGPTSGAVALFTTTSTLPWRCAIAPAIAFQPCSVPTSAMQTSTRPPSPTSTRR